MNAHALATVVQTVTVMAGHPFDVLDKASVPDHVIFDWIRVIAATSSFLLLLFYLRIAFGSERPQTHSEVVTIRLGIISYIAMLMPVALTELEQVGNPLVLWRLPFVLAANIFGWWYVTRRL